MQKIILRHLQRNGSLDETKNINLNKKFRNDCVVHSR